MAAGGWVAYVGLGGNVPRAAGGRLEPPERTLGLAGQALRELGTVVAGSGLWRTEPVGPVREQAAFVNGAVALRTGLGPEELMGALLEMEQRFGRVREVAQGPRTLDLDLLLMLRVEKLEGLGGPGEELVPVVREGPGLRLPHPEMHRRRFVLAPLAEIAPGVRHPGLGRTVAELLAELPKQEQVERMDGPGLGWGVKA